jgi:hypothetical protein
MASAAGGARAARQARRPVEGCQWGPKSDAFEHKVPSVDRFRRPWPEAIWAAAQKIGANRNSPQHDDFPDARNRRIDPNIGPGLGLVGWRENRNDQDRISNDRFLGLIFRADHRQNRDPDIMFRLNPRNNARVREHAAQARPLRKMARDKPPAKLRLYGPMGAAGGRHRLRLSVHELPKLAIPASQARNSATVILTGSLAISPNIARRDFPREWNYANGPRPRLCNNSSGPISGCHAMWTVGGFVYSHDTPPSGTEGICNQMTYGCRSLWTPLMIISTRPTFSSGPWISRCYAAQPL